MKGKKWILTAALAALAISTMAGCGGADETTQESAQESSQETAAESASETQTQQVVEYGEAAYLDGLNVADYVTLGEYKGLEVSVEAPSVSDESVQSYIDYVLQNNPSLEEVTGRPVQEGDVVNIDYVGKIDGVAFDGGTAEGYDLEIGSGSFIDGFEDGLIGAEVGETRDVQTTFPEDYRSAEVAGKDAVFTVTVNSIQVEVEAELNDEFVQGLNVGCETVDDFRQYVYDLLMEDEQYSHDAEVQVNLLESVLANATFQELPEEMQTRYYDRLVNNVNYYATMSGYDVDAYMEANGITEEYLQQSAEDATKELIAMGAIADAEGLNVTDAEVDAQLEEEAAQYGYEDVEEYKALIDVKAYKEYMMTDKVLSFLEENAVITDVEAASEGETAEAGTSGEETVTDGTEETVTSEETASEELAEDGTRAEESTATEEEAQ